MSQVVGALKGYYSTAMTMTAERMAAAILAQQPTFPSALLSLAQQSAPAEPAGLAFDAQAQVGIMPPIGCHLRSTSYCGVVLLGSLMPLIRQCLAQI